MEGKEDRYTLRERDHQLHLALSGDEEALGSLLASYMPQLYRAARRILGTPQDAEEALQDGMVQVVQHFREFEGRSQFSTWLTRIVINAALMRLRRSRPEVMTSIDQKDDRHELSVADSITDTRPNPEEVYARKEQLQIFKQKLWSLPATYRSALWLRDVQGMSTKEAAQALGVPVGSLKSQLHRARSRLKADMGATQATRRTLRAARSEAAITRHQVNVKLTQEVVRPAA